MKKCIAEKTALIVRDNDVSVGVLLFSYNEKEIGFLAVHPQCRQQGIASALVKKLCEQFPEDAEIAVTTYRKNDPKGEAARAFY